MDLKNLKQWVFFFSLLRVKQAGDAYVVVANALNECREDHAMRVLSLAATVCY